MNKERFDRQMNAGQYIIWAGNRIKDLEEADKNMSEEITSLYDEVSAAHEEMGEYKALLIEANHVQRVLIKTLDKLTGS